MSVVFADRYPTQIEIERFRLILSTYQDGSGQYAIKTQYPWLRRNNAQSMPGWRDFERAVAVVFNGESSESKHVYDVRLPNAAQAGTFFGVSCKMRNELRTARTKHRAYMELTNSSKKLWAAVKSNNELNEENYTNWPHLVGEALLDIVEDWHFSVDVSNGQEFIGSQSFFLNLLYDQRSGIYQLFQFPISLPKPQDLTWHARGQTIIGDDGEGTVMEWFALSGGQLKYFPPLSYASWRSEPFVLERLPDNLEQLTLEKARNYFPELWHTL